MASSTGLHYSTEMILYYSALYSEAKAIIKGLNLKKDITYKSHELYRSESTLLLIGGIGKLKAAIAAKTIPVNQYTQLSLLDQFTKFVEVERNSDSADKSQQQILDHIGAMMTNLPFNIGGRDPNGNAVMHPDIRKFDHTAIELTYEEQLRLSTHQDIANQDMLMRLKFPVTESTMKLEGPNA